MVKGSWAEKKKKKKTEDLVVNEDVSIFAFSFVEINLE